MAAVFKNRWILTLILWGLSPVGFAKSSTVLVKSNVRASVLVDGILAGDAGAPITLKAGKTVLTVKARGYQARRIMLATKPRQKKVLRVNLKKLRPKPKPKKRVIRPKPRPAPKVNDGDGLFKDDEPEFMSQQTQPKKKVVASSRIKTRPKTYRRPVPRRVTARHQVKPRPVSPAYRHRAPQTRRVYRPAPPATGYQLPSSVAHGASPLNHAPYHMPGYYYPPAVPYSHSVLEPSGVATPPSEGYFR